MSEISEHSSEIMCCETAANAGSEREEQYMEYHKRVEGKNVYLSPMREEDAPKYVEWLNDPQILKNIGTPQMVYDIPTEMEWIRENRGKHQFAIVKKGEDRLIGNCGIQQQNQRDRAAEVGIFIGSVEDRGKGYGTEALGLLVEYGFQQLNFHSICLHVYSFNERAIRAYKKIGFQEAGRLRECYWADGRWHDRLIMDLLDHEWLSFQSHTSSSLLGNR